MSAALAALVAFVKIHKLAGESIWICRAYLADGSRLAAADCEESERGAAEDTAAAMVRPYFDKLAEVAAAVVDSLPVKLSAKYAAEFREELRHRINTSCESADGSEPAAVTVRGAVAAALIDCEAMGIDYGGAYRAGGFTAENGGRAWRAIFAETCRQLAGDYAAEFAEHTAAMRAIDLQFLTAGKS